MSDNWHWWSGVAFGALTAVAVFCLLLAGISWRVLGTDLEEWQTLATGVLAVAAAFGTGLILRGQINATAKAAADQIVQLQQQEAHRRERKNYADRSALPAALASLGDYGRHNLEALSYIRNYVFPEEGASVRGERTALPLPEVPASSVETVRACIETEATENRAALREILLELQIMHSRLGATSREFEANGLAGGAAYIHDYIVEVLEFLARCGSAIVVARGDRNAPRVSLDEMTNEAFLRDIRDSNFPEVHAIIVRRYQ